MAARHLSPGDPEPAPTRAAAVWWILGVLVVIVAVLVVVGIRAAAMPGAGTVDTRPPAAASGSSGSVSGSGSGGSATASAVTSSIPARGASASGTPSPAPTEDATAVRQAETLMADSERRLGSVPWKLTSVLRGRSCPLSTGRLGLQSEWTDEGPASTAQQADLATLDSYWRGLGLQTRRTTVSDPTGTFAAVQGDGGPVSSIRYSVSGAITTVSVCRAPR